MKFKRLIDYDNTCADTFEVVKDSSSLTVQDDYVPFEQLIRYYNVKLPDGLVYDDTDDELDDVEPSYQEYLDDKTTYDNFIDEVKNAKNTVKTFKSADKDNSSVVRGSDVQEVPDTSADKGNKA